LKNLKDEELMLLVTNGNLDFMSYIFERYHLKIFNYVLKMTRNKEVSKDITQEVFYKLIKHRNTYKQTKFSPWIYTIARNLCNDYYKTVSHTQKSIEQINYKTMDVENDDTVPKELTEHLQLALNKLSTSDKELIIMSRYQGIKYDEIAIITNSNVGAVKTKIHRALHKLKALYFQNT
jgi:RNA polymerase sigma-70 factor (ECF subfamily)